MILPADLERIAAWWPPRLSLEFRENEWNLPDVVFDLDDYDRLAHPV